MKSLVIKTLNNMNKQAKSLVYLVVWKTETPIYKHSSKQDIGNKHTHTPLKKNREHGPLFLSNVGKLNYWPYEENLRGKISFSFTLELH